MAGRGGATAEQHVGIRGQPCHSTHTPPPAHDGQFLLQMLRQNHPQNPTTSTPTHPPPPTPTSSSATVSASLSVYNQLVDPAIAALGPSLPFTPHPNSPPYDKPLLPALSETRFPSSPWTNALVPENNHFAPLNLPGFSEVPWPRRIDGFDHGNSHFKASVMPVPGNLSASGPDFGRKQQHGVCNPTQPGILGNFQGFVGNRNKFDDGNTRELKMEESNSQSWPLTFGSIPCELRNLERLSCGNSSGSLNPVEEKALKGEISLKSHVQGAVRILSKRATDQEAMVTGSSIDSPLCSTDCGIDLSTRESFYNRENRGVHVHQQHGRGDPRGRFNKMDSNVKQTVAFQRSSIQDGAHVSHKERSRPPGFLQRFGTGKGAEQRVPKNERQEGERSMYGDEDGSNNWNRSPLYAEGGNVHNRIGEEEMLMEKLLGNRRNQSGDCGSIPAIPNPKSWSEMGESWSRRVSVDNELVDRHSRQGGDVPSRLLLTAQFDHPGPPRESNLHSVPASDIEQSLTSIHGKDAGEKCRPGVHNSERTNRASSSRGSINGKVGAQEQDMFAEEIMGSLIRREEFANKNARGHYYSSSGKGPQPPGQRMSSRRREMECRSDLERHTSYFISIYETLIPAAEEKAKQKQLLESLEKLISKEWPGAQLYLYGSCANSFGVSNSDIDVCLEINESDMSKSDILLKLADILLSDNLQNVQALTRARVPIVKLMDPMTGISCDICINNALAVVNTKLLRDYSEIDVRLRQLAFIVKHWAKSRRVNETYQGTLSSYAYVLMCIHFLQMRKLAILPCLQEMKATYVVTVDEIECAYFDQVEKLHDFGAQNKETISQLLWAFFDYWAYRHDYANSVISVRTGSFISKREKDWTRRIGNDRHLICIEDPFETSHDLGRVVDKYSIKILREEFERAANILNYDPNPSVTLFEPYVPG